MKRGFTLIELVVAVALLALITSFAGAIFSASIDSYRTAMANAEIMEKLRAITDQLDSDFRHLRKDGEICVGWVARFGDPNMGDPARYVRFDRIMFFANGDFQTYNQQYGDIRGDVARISYMLGSRYAIPTNIPESEQQCRKRILTRTQHILTANDTVPGLPNLAAVPPDAPALYEWNNRAECEKMTLQQWNNIEPLSKGVALATILNTRVGMGATIIDPLGGTVVDPADPATIHAILCEGVGEFKVQGWYDAEQRWVPEIDRNGDRNLADSDFPLVADGSAIDPYLMPGVLYNPEYGGVGIPTAPFDPNFIDAEHFNEIPGLGRALKFTFTLYDSKGIIREGRTFTHIVYLDD